MTSVRKVANGFDQSESSYNVKVTDSSSVVHAGDVQHMNLDGIAPSLSIGQLSNYTSPTVEASAIVKASPGKLFVVSGFNSHATSQLYALVFNSTTVPINGTVPLFPIVCDPGLTFGYTGPALYGRYFSTGITIAFSTTIDSLTIVTGVNIKMHLDVQYL